MNVLAAIVIILSALVAGTSDVNLLPSACVLIAALLAFWLGRESFDKSENE